MLCQMLARKVGLARALSGIALWETSASSLSGIFAHHLFFLPHLFTVEPAFSSPVTQHHSSLFLWFLESFTCPTPSGANDRQFFFKDRCIYSNLFEQLNLRLGMFHGFKRVLSSLYYLPYFYYVRGKYLKAYRFWSSFWDACSIF